MVTQTRELSIDEYSEECAISSETFKELAIQKDLVAISCGHKFSRIAITGWFERSATCPLCLRHVEKDHLTDVAIATDITAKKQLPKNIESAHSRLPDFSLNIKKINGLYSPNDAFEAACRESLNSSSREKIDKSTQKKSERKRALPTEPHPRARSRPIFEHHTMYEVVLTCLEGQSAKTFISFDSLRQNRERVCLENAKLGDVFNVPGYFLVDWNRRINPATGSHFYRFEPTHGDTARKQQLIEQAKKEGRNFYGI